ncbi:MAG: hypothetical protein J5I59_00225 [Saprospiraceae bacterium]|nr:hypothetical protein [Saprospiraceae bacterium]
MHITSIFTPQWRQYAKSKHYLSNIQSVKWVNYILPQHIHTMIKNLRCLERLVAGKPFHDADIHTIKDLLCCLSMPPGMHGGVSEYLPSRQTEAICRSCLF